LEYLLDTALSVAERYARDNEADRYLAALVTPEVQCSPDRYRFVNALVSDSAGTGVVKICLRDDQEIAWDTRHMSRQDIAQIAEHEREVARRRAAFLTEVLRGLRGCGSK